MSEELMIKFSEMTDEELIAFKEDLEDKYEILCDRRAKDFADLGVDFDPYTRSGERKINKIIMKYQDDEDGWTFLMEETLREMKKRQISSIDLEIEKTKSENEKLTDEQYISQELNKNKKFRNKK